MEIITVSAEDLKDEIEHSSNLTVVNVLTKEYFDDCHIKGSINAPLDQLKTIASEWDKNRKLIVYCASYTCTASKTAHSILTEMGFKNVRLYEGGTKEWKEKNYNRVGRCKKDCLKK